MGGATPRRRIATQDEEPGCSVLLMPVAGVLLLAVAAGQASDALGELLDSLGLVLLGTRWFTPYLAVPFLLAAQRILLGPVKLAHARIPRNSSEPRNIRRADRRSRTLALWAFLLDRATLLVVARAGEHGGAFWFLMQPSPEQPGAFAREALVALALLWLAQFLVVRFVLPHLPSLFAILITGPWGGFLGRYRGRLFDEELTSVRELSILTGAWLAVLVDGGVFLLAFVLNQRNPFFLSVLFCSVVLRIASYPVWLLLSMWLDRRNDQWVTHLGGSLTASGEVARRLDAAVKLGHLAAVNPSWIWPVRPALEAATKDDDERVRKAAAEALAPTV